MKLWTFQSLDQWDTLQRDGVLRKLKEPEGKCPDFLNNWIAEQTANRVGPPLAENLQPFWAWHRCRKSAGPNKPVNWLCGLWDVKEFVRLEIEMPRSNVLLSDFGKWENLDFFHGFVPGGNWGQLYGLEKDLTAAGFFPEILIDGVDIGRLVELQDTLRIPSLDMNQIHRALAHPDIGPRIRQSWEIIFNVHYRNGRMRHVWLQGTFWELRLDQVVGVTRTNRCRPGLSPMLSTA